MPTRNTTLDNPPDLTTFGSVVNAAIVGASGGIGHALAKILIQHDCVARVMILSRREPRSSISKTIWRELDIESEESVVSAAQTVHDVVGTLHLVIVASGVLHDDEGLTPEKSWRQIDAEALVKSFRVNTAGPSLVAKHFLPLLAKDRKSVFAALSARVGSISDNRLGGWYAYRASKAALNMTIKTLSIELARSNPQALCVALHPGTVDSRLSRPFQVNVPQCKLFTPDFAARQLLNVINRLTPEQTGRIFAWDGAEIDP